MKKAAIILALCGVIGTGQNLSGQQADIMYFMKDNALQHNLNPAFQPECNIYVGFPGLSSLNVSVGNNSLTFSDIYHSRVVDGKKQTVSFLHPVMGQDGIDDFLKRLRNNTRLYSEVGVSLISFGFRQDKSYFTFDLSNRVDAQLIVPKSVPTVFFRGVEDEDGETVFSLRNLSFSSTAYTQLAFGYSRELDKQWNFGGKLKLLLGHANMDADFGDLSLTISKERWLLQGNSSLRSAVPGLEVITTEDGVLDDVDFNNDHLGFSRFFSGVGAGADFGAAYNLLENLQFSASVVDLGFIRWSKNLNKVNKENDFEFDGIVYDVNNDSINYWDEYKDMLKRMYVLENNPAGYTTWLTAKIYAGVEYSILDDKIGFGLLSKTYITKKKAFEELVLSSNYRPFYPLSVSLSYSILNGKWSNLGFGVNLNAGPFNMFLCADNIPLKYGKGDGVFVPVNTKMTSVSFGINFIFGRNKKNAEAAPVIEEAQPELIDSVDNEASELEEGTDTEVVVEEIEPVSPDSGETGSNEPEVIDNQEQEVEN